MDNRTTDVTSPLAAALEIIHRINLTLLGCHHSARSKDPEPKLQHSGNSHSVPATPGTSGHPHQRAWGLGVGRLAAPSCLSNISPEQGSKMLKWEDRMN